MVRVRLLAENADKCEAKLIFDDTIFEDTNKDLNPCQLGSANIVGELARRVRVKRENPPAPLAIEGRANGLF